jgi:hypothetical protein
VWAPRAGLDDVEERKFLALLGLELQPLGRRPPCRVGIPTALSRLPLEDVTRDKLDKRLRSADSNVQLGRRDSRLTTPQLEGSRAEAEESPLLEAVVREWLV